MTLSYRSFLLPVFLSALLLMLTPAGAQSMNARNLIKLARASADAKDWTKARDYANKALAEEQGYLDAYYMRAFANRQLGEKKKAEEDFREVIRRDPDFLPTYGALADMYIADKEYDKAEKIFNELGQQNDGAKWASYYRGVVAYLKGDLKKAETQWKDVLSKDVNFVMAIHNLGAVALARKDYPRALTNFREAVELKPDHPMYRFHLAWALEKTNQVPKAQEILKGIMNDSADDQQFWLLARALDQILRNRPDVALKVLETLTKDYPETLDVWVLQGRASLASGKTEQAREALKKAKELDSQFGEVDDLLSKLPAEAVVPKAPEAEPVEKKAEPVEKKAEPVEKKAEPVEKGTEPNPVETPAPSTDPPTP